MLSAPVRGAASVVRTGAHIVSPGERDTAEPRGEPAGVGRAAAGVAKLGAGAAMAGVSAAAFTAGLVKGTVSQLPQAAVGVLPTDAARESVGAARALLDAHPRRQRRRVWTGHGRAHIEVRGLDGNGQRKLTKQVPSALRRLHGVRWARVNAVTGQVLVAFDERRLSVDTLLDTVRAVEKDHGSREDDFSWQRPTHPGDSASIAAVAAELAADCVATSMATVQTVFRFSPMPRSLRTVTAMLDIERGLRSGLKRRIGPVETDLVLTLANAAVHGLSRGIASPAVDALYRTTLLAEVWERRQAWNRMEPELSGRASTVPDSGPRPQPRPEPRPDGPIEEWSRRLGPLTSGAVAAVLALTRNPGRASDAFQAAVPRAARYGREGFAAAVGRDLARRGVVPLNAAAFRRLDRVSVIVLDARVLVTSDGELDPKTDAVLEAARESGATIHLTAQPEADELVPWADETVDQALTLSDHVRRLQAEGQGVLVVSASDEDAMSAADVAVAVLDVDTTSYWSADLVCANGLEDVWRILCALKRARPVSRSAVRLAQAGSALGVLSVLTADRRSRIVSELPPVQVAALLALLHGTVAGVRATRGSPPPPISRVPWHELDARDAYARLMRTRAGQPPHPPPVGTGLPGVAFVSRQAQEVAGLAKAVYEELRDPLTPVLAVGAAASVIVGSALDGVLVGAVLTGNVLISGGQRLRVERALRHLLAEQEISARRLRLQDLERLTEAQVESVVAGALVPGDVIELRASDVVPADARLLDAEDLEVDESTLTGESLPVAKDTLATPGAAVAERSGMVFEGTSVLAGSGYAVVVATGRSTEAGRATAVAGRAPRPAGLQARLQEVTRLALPVTAIGGAAVTGVGLLRGLPLRQAIAAGVSLAVAAVPEGLPLVATVAQAGGARRLSQQGTLVRTSRALEALGRVDVVCFDKTGTLTEGRLRLTRLASGAEDLTPGEPESDVLLAAAGRACPAVGSDEVSRLPHATDRAVLEAAVAADEVHRAGWELITELPFETRRGYFAALGRTEDGPQLVVKGAPEVILPLCDAAEGAKDTVERLAADGLRVLAVAERRDDVPEQTDELESLVSGLQLLGFVGIADAPRAEAAEAVNELTGAGTRVVMVTGDHPETARAVAAATGIANGAVLTGAEMDRMSERERTRRVARCTVFARVSPEHKVQIVDALQRERRVVAMIGDGVNDAAAIRLADVGIGVRAQRSTSAQSSADLVLTNADIRQVHRAVLEGRALWRRARDAVSILVGGNAGEVTFMLLGTALAGRAPINTRQMLLVNMLTDMFPALAVALAGNHDDEDHNGPVGPMLGAPLAKAVAVRGGATALGATLAWTAGRFTGRRQRAGTMGLAALIMTQLGQTMLAGRHSRLVIGTCAGSAVALVVAVQTPGLSQFLGCTPLGPVAWGSVFAAAGAGTAAAAVAPRLVT
ncbi:cation-translocating P-type ATPase [Phytoactinopolyspora mesophila]|nr:cation-translocating P-type ATPase [Phytoactinopolyspora mesophila]